MLCLCALYFCVCVDMSTHVQVPMCVSAYGRQRSALGGLLSLSSPCSLRQGLLLNLEFTDGLDCLASR